MINKVAEMTRLAEVRGCMAAFHDAGLIKCASEDAFDHLCNVVAENIGFDYDLEKIAKVTDAAVSQDRDRQMRNAKLAKTAAGFGGKVMDALTLKGIRNVAKSNNTAKQLLDGKLPNPGNLPLDPADLVRAGRQLKFTNKLKNYGKAAVAPALAYGGGAAALGGLGLAGKATYDGYVGA